MDSGRVLLLNIINKMNIESDLIKTSTKAQKLKFLIPVYIFLYTSITIWVLIDGWINNFSSLQWLWNIPPESKFSNLVIYLFFTTFGAILGSAVLGIISFHKYSAIEKNFDIDHSWGFILSPILAAIIGILAFAVTQSGLLVLTGGINDNINSDSASLGFFAIGSITGYNWDVFINKLQEMSSSLFKPSSKEN